MRMIKTFTNQKPNFERALKAQSGEFSIQKLIIN